MTFSIVMPSEAFRVPFVSPLPLAIRNKDVIRKVLAFKDIRIQLGQEKLQSIEDYVFF